MGLTHFAIKSGTYFSEVLGYSVAVIELLNQGAFTKLSEVCMGKKVQEQGFEIMKVTYYENTSVGSLIQIINHKYDILIIDMGSNYEVVKDEFLRCNQKVIIGALSEWKESDFHHFIKWANLQPGNDKWDYHYIFGTAIAEKDFKSKYKKRIQKIPYSVDPFTVQKDEINFYNYLFKY